MLLLSMCASRLSAIQDAAVEKAHSNGVAYKKNIFTNRIKFWLEGNVPKTNYFFIFSLRHFATGASRSVYWAISHWSVLLRGYLLKANGTGRNSRQHNITKNWHTAEERRAKKHNYWPTDDTGGLRDRRLAMLQPVAERHRFECLSGEDWEYQPIPAAWVINDQQTSQ